MATSKIVVGYVRCSSLEQVADNQTIPRQKAMIEHHCQERGIEKLVVIADEGLSGYKSARPGYQELLRLCREGQVASVIVTDLSRLSRSVRDAFHFLEEVVQPLGIDFVSLGQNLDTSTPMGKAVFGFTSIFNQLYRDEISHKTKISIAFKKSQGQRYSGNVPYGFEDAGDGVLVASEADAAVIERIQELRGQGLSLRKIAVALEAEGHRTKKGLRRWNTKVILDLLRRSADTRGP